VNRALATIVALALIATLSLAPASTPLSGSGRAAAADCAWQRHSQRLVKHVKRDGRVRRLVRTRHWWSCNPLAVPPQLAVPPTVPPAGPEPAPAPEASPPPRTVSVKAEDAEAEHFNFSLSRPYVVSGEVTVQLNNQGMDSHNLNLRLAGSEEAPLQVGEAGPGESRVGRFDLPPGSYRLWCSLPQHDEWGMNVELEVKGG
jgi:hypothetical protein